MSYDLNVYVRKDRLPSAAALRERLARAGRGVELRDIDDLTNIRGFVPVMLDGALTGFELYSSDITDRDRDEYRELLKERGEAPDEFLKILTTCDLDVGFSCKASDSRERVAARIVATALAEAAQGWLSDPQTDETISYAAR
ncbi:MAG: hypothetical protein ACM31C_02130 [Acidobacteriota bacterium]